MSRTRTIRGAAALLFLAVLSGTLGPAPARAASGVAVGDLRVEQQAAPLGIDADRPRLSWRLTSPRRGEVQTAYQVLVASGEEQLAADRGDVWDSGQVASAESVNVRYDGPALQPRQRYHWKVRVWDRDGVASQWSPPAWWETGLPAAEWDASLIGHHTEVPSWGDVTVTAEVDPQTGPAGVYFHADGPNNGYAWQIEQQASGAARYVREGLNFFGLGSAARGLATLRKLRFDEGTLTSLGTVSLADVPATLGEPFALTVQVVGTQIRTSVNGREVDTTTDDRHRSGTVGLSLGTRHGLFQYAEFDSLQVSTPAGVVYSDDFTVDRGDLTGGRVADGVVAMDGWPNAFLVPGARQQPLLRREFSVDGAVRRARVYATALGIYELSLNGTRVGDHQLAPGWTDYDERVQYQSYDVTNLLQPGDNALGAILGSGWYAGHVGFFGSGHWGLRPQLLAQLHVDYADGRSVVVSTDGSWRASDSPITRSDLLLGEEYDARAAQPGWNQPGFDASAWAAVDVNDATSVTPLLVAQVDPPARIVSELRPVSVTEKAAGRYVVDLGQNMVGWVRLNVRGGNADDRVTLRHAEVLDPATGELYTENLRTATAMDTYTKAGGGNETYEPRFTFHGFRFVEVAGYQAPLTAEDITGLVVHTDAPLTSQFETSNPMVNQIHRNLVWGQRGNFLSVPMDTPARDERMGWTGDINVFASTAAYNMDVGTFLEKWLADLRDAQDPDGAIPDVAPDLPAGRGHLATGTSGWGDAAVTVPWTLWQRYGDTAVIDDNYEMMTRWVAWLEQHTTNLIRPSVGYGDHVALETTPTNLIGTAFFARSTRYLAQMAAATGRAADAQRYEALFADIKAAFIGAFVQVDGRVTGNTQTSYALALAFDLLPDTLRAAAAGHLVERIEARGWHISTGFLGTEQLLPVLTDAGRVDVAYRLLENQTFPSWGFKIANGATTMWEHWDAFHPDNGFQDPYMTSFNHYAFGSVGNWLMGYLAGIQSSTDVPGFRHTVIRPHVGGTLQHASATYASRLGDIRSAWRTDASGALTLEIDIPGNVTAIVHVPTNDHGSVTESGVPAAGAPGVTYLGYADGAAVFEVGSGHYSWTSSVSPPPN